MAAKRARDDNKVTQLGERQWLALRYVYAPTRTASWCAPHASAEVRAAFGDDDAELYLRLQPWVDALVRTEWPPERPPRPVCPVEYEGWPWSVLQANDWRVLELLLPEDLRATLWCRNAQECVVAATGHHYWLVQFALRLVESSQAAVYLQHMRLNEEAHILAAFVATERPRLPDGQTRAMALGGTFTLHDPFFLRTDDPDVRYVFLYPDFVCGPHRIGWSHLLWRAYLSPHVTHDLAVTVLDYVDPEPSPNMLENVVRPVNRSFLCTLPECCPFKEAQRKK